MINKSAFVLIAIILSALLTNCSKKTISQEEIYINQIKESRLDKDRFYQNSPTSIFLKGSCKKFHSLEYFEPNPKFIFKSKFYKYPNETKIRFQYSRGKKGESFRYGYFLIQHNDKTYKLNVYRTKPLKLILHYDALEARFKDLTTGKSTSLFGRILDIFLVPDSNFVYSIDFNLAYNQLSEYDSLSSCPLPLKEDSLGFAIEAGEKLFK